MDISKLPKWAQLHIANLQRERDVAVKALTEYMDDQTESEFFIDDFLCTGEGKGSSPQTIKRYIQTYNMGIIHAGVRLDIMLRDNQIDLGWMDAKGNINQVAFIPTSFQQAKLVAPENMNK